MDRRTFLIGALTAALPSPARALGIPAGPDLVAAFETLAGAREGTGDGTLHVVYAPWCHVSPLMHRDSRHVLGRLAIRWIPYSGGQPEGSSAAERLLGTLDPADVPRTFVRMGTLPAARAATPLCDAQDLALATRVEPLVARDAARALVTPTLAYRMRDGRVRVIPGAITAAQFAEVAALAG